ncbi:MAG: glycosyltransferase family 4 protein [Acidimicrobiales bacterium]
MRIGMISPYSLTVPGGVQGQILGLARAIRARGESVRVLGPCDGPPPEPFVTPLGNSIPTGANGSVAPIAPDPAAQLRTIRALRDEDFDVLHLHEPMAPGPTMTALLLKPAPVVATFHAAGSSLAYEVFKPLTSRGSHRINRRFAVSDDARLLAEAALGGAYEIVFNGVEVARFRSIPPRKAEGPTIFFVARHEDRKGLEVLLDAFNDLPSETMLWVGGVGPQTVDLQRRFAGDPRIDWLGELDESEKIACMRGADVFCAPSLGGESFGIVLLEAMAAETAVVASDLPGYAKVTRDGRDAELVEPGNAPALAASLRAVLSDRTRRDELVASGAERVLDFSMRRLSGIYLDAYRSLVGSA